MRALETQKAWILICGRVAGICGRVANICGRVAVVHFRCKIQNLKKILFLKIHESGPEESRMSMWVLFGLTRIVRFGRSLGHPTLENGLREPAFSVNGVRGFQASRIRRALSQQLKHIRGRAPQGIVLSTEICVHIHLD